MFKQILCINIASRTDRWQQITDECKRVGIAVERIDACTPDKAIENSPFVAFNTSQKWSLEKLHTFPAMILEDDCVFGNMSHLAAAMSELPPTWDLCYLGGNILGIDVIPFQKPVRFSEHLFRVKDCWQTHALVYSKIGVEKILSKFSVTNGYNYDEFLRQTILPDGEGYIVAPQMAYQRAGHSDIWNCHVQTEHLFEQGNKLLV